MDDETKKALCVRATLEGVPCNIAGYANVYASISPQCGGFWRAEWDTVKRVIETGGEFKAADVTFSSGAWLGTGVEMPDVLRRKAGRRYFEDDNFLLQM